MNANNSNNNLAQEVESKKVENMYKQKSLIKSLMNIDNEMLPITVKAIINGEQQEITPAFTNYSMEQPNNKKKLLDLADSNKMLDVIFHFAEPNVFWNEGYDLFDRNGQQIKKDTPNVYVSCDMADTYWRIFVDSTLKHVETHTFDTVKDYATTIGNSTLLSRGLNNVEKVGYAALATGNEAYKAVFEFAKKNELNISTAQLYFDLKFRPANTSIMLLGRNPKNEPSLGRSVDCAQILYEEMCLTFHKGGAKKRYAIQVVNNLLKDKKCSYEEMLEALRTIPANEIAMTEIADCGDKSICIMGALTSWLINMRRNNKNAA